MNSFTKPYQKDEDLSEFIKENPNEPTSEQDEVDPEWEAFKCSMAKVRKSFDEVEQKNKQLLEELKKISPILKEMKILNQKRNSPSQFFASKPSTLPIVGALVLGGGILALAGILISLPELFVLGFAIAALGVIVGVISDDLQSKTSAVTMSL